MFFRFCFFFEENNLQSLSVNHKSRRNRRGSLLQKLGELSRDFEAVGPGVRIRARLVQDFRSRGRTRTRIQAALMKMDAKVFS